MDVIDHILGVALLTGKAISMPDTSPAPASVLNRAWGQIARAVQEIVPRKRSLEIALKPDLPESDEEKLVAAFEECVEHRGGEVQARARAAALGDAYLNLEEEGRRRFLELLATRFAPSRKSVDAAMEAVQSAADDGERSKAEQRLRVALDPPRARVLRQFNALPDGVKFLVDLRADLMRWRRETPALAPLEEDLRRILVSWFDIGFLEMRQMDWTTPAALLEKLIEYEAVHRIKSWDDLKNRLDADRRCYGFFHPRMPQEPLIFVEVALVNGIAGDVQALLDESGDAGDPAEADTAIFYSISNAQAGLAGISFGDFLIKRVAARLTAELPNIKTFATLSPIPGFRRWLERSPEEAAETPISADEITAIRKALALTQTASDDDAPSADGEGDEADALALIEAAFALPHWSSDGALRDALEAPLTRLVADYLYNRRRPDGRALDPVAHFHLSNGARMERLNWLGDRSANGLRQSAGMMINYLYKLSEIDANHEAYSSPDRQIIASSAIKSAAKR